MGAWDEDGTVWLPRSRYTRSQARTFYSNLCGFPWIEARVRARWMHYTPTAPGADEYDGEFWTECDRDTPGAFPVWRCE
jgi:hypothetical protein